LVAVVADVAVVAVPVRFPVTFPVRFAVTVPAEKLPSASLRTIVEAVLEFVAAFARTDPEATFEAVWPPTLATTVEDWVPVTSPEREPEKLVEVVEVVAFPDRFAVTVPAEKLPEASLRTMVEAVFKFVEAFASEVAEATFAALCPPTEETTVEVCVPVTSPRRNPVNDVEVVAFPDRLAVMVPAAKSPDASRLTMVEARSELVAEFEATVAVATLEAV
jgi:hypothetical protein